MKKILAITLAVVMLLLMASCGGAKTDNEVGDNTAQTSAVTSAEPSNDEPKGAVDVLSPEDFQKLVEKYIDVSHYKDAEVTDKNYIRNLKEEYYPDYAKSPDARLFSDQNIIINGTDKIAMDMNASDFMDQGWTFAIDDLNSEKLDPNLLTMGFETKKDGKSVYVGFYNDTEKKLAYKDCKIGRIEFYEYNSDDKYAVRGSKAPDFLIDGKIDQTSSFEDVVKALGEPRSLYYSVIGDEDSYSYLKASYDEYSLTGYNVEFTFSADLSRIANVRFY